LALLLTVGFYGLALTVVGVLLFIPYAEIRFADRLHLRVAIGCLIGAGTILWSILPRRDRFEAPGPRLDPDQHPRLFDQVEEIARETDQDMPEDVYLIPEVNAFVVERGGIWGIGSRRVMGIGLPLLQVLDVAQFRAVIAHEFGHFHSGDTRLGPWIYKLRRTIIRTVLGLGSVRSSWLQAPFKWYGKLFLRTTNAVSRRQEFVADALATRVAGAEPLKEGLRTIHGTAPAFRGFWQEEFAPALGAGYRPSLAEGFSLFIDEGLVAERMERTVKREMEAAETNPYDTHPPLRERISALETFPAKTSAEDAPPAISLVADVPELEQDLLSHAFGEEKTRSLEPLAWQETATKVHAPLWEKVVDKYGTLLEGVTTENLPAYLETRDRWIEQLAELTGRPLTQDQAAGAALSVAEMGLALALFKEGWEPKTRPGAEITMHRGDQVIRPFSEIEKLASGETTEATWRQRCEEAGIAGLALS
jgi:Zn-dependent protease with chaperone function